MLDDEICDLQKIRMQLSSVIFRCKAVEQRPRKPSLSIVTINHPDSLRLTLVEAFLAAAAYGNYMEAGTLLGIDATTVRRRVEQLEIWLHRPLITTDVPFEITEFADDFVLVAAKVVELIDEGGLKAEIGKTRVQADGTVTIDGHKIDTRETREIGKSLVACRAIIDPNYTPPFPISGKDIDMSFWQADGSKSRTPLNAKGPLTGDPFEIDDRQSGTEGAEHLD